MLLQGLVVDDNIIKIRNNKKINERSRYLVNENAKRGQCIHDTKRHD